MTSAQACLRLLVASMRAVGDIAAEVGVDPTRPSVPEFGRHLYNLPIKKLVNSEPKNAITQKVMALGAGRPDDSLIGVYREGFEAWRKEFSKQKFGGLVVDYDGTVCATSRRYQLPDHSIQDAILRVLKDGLYLGFATGRGKSIHKDLRQWIPKEYWHQIFLGLYNGAVRIRLTDELPDLRTPTPLMNSIESRLSTWPFANLIEIETRVGQVSISTLAGSFFHDLSLSRGVSDLLMEAPMIDAKVVSSGHSVDIVAPDTTKVTVLHDVEGACGRPVMAIGDQGQSGGNDYELLAATKWSLSVDRCSADPTRCWRISRRDRRGPSALEEILTRLKLGGRTARLPIRPQEG
jgi:hypothetical protein